MRINTTNHESPGGTVHSNTDEFTYDMGIVVARFLENLPQCLVRECVPILEQDPTIDTVVLYGIGGWDQRFLRKVHGKYGTHFVSYMLQSPDILQDLYTYMKGHEKMSIAPGYDLLFDHETETLQLIRSSN